MRERALWVLRLAAAGLLLLAVLLHLGRFSNLLDALTHFALLLLIIVALATTASAFVARRVREFAVVAGLGSAALLLALMAPELVGRPGRADAPADAPRVRLLQFNLWMDNRDPKATARYILQSGADIVFVEEVTGFAQEIPAALAGRYPYQVSRGGTAEEWILSRWPLKAETSLVYGAAPKIIAATVSPPDRPAFTVVGAHLTWPLPPGVQQWQSGRLARFIRTLDPQTTIVAGDFNSTPWSFSLRRQDAGLRLERRTHGLATWPARKALASLPFLAIDQIYAGSDWRTVSVSRGARAGSDHYPVLATLAYAPGPKTP